jgi:hypothetical protein
MKKYLVGIVACAAIGAAIVAVAEPPSTTLPASLLGRGKWWAGAQSKDSVPPGQRWEAQVQRGADNSIRGRATMRSGSANGAGNIVGQISDGRVSGTIFDDEGNGIAIFDGVVTSDGIDGHFATSAGDVGSWSWDGEVLAPESAECVQPET